VWNTGAGEAQQENEPYSLNYLLGVQAMRYYATADVILLIMLFFHRYMLRRLGLWKDANVQDTVFTVSIRHRTPEEARRTKERIEEEGG